MSKRALLVGCNYPGTDAALQGCINDVFKMKEILLTRYGFDERDLVIMIDTDKSYPQPTGANIRQALNKIVMNTDPGDFLFMHFSGHGVQVPSESGIPDDTGFDECIVPTDMNLLTDDDFRDIISKVPEGVTFTFVSDSCHSGGLIDHEREQIGSSTTEGPATGIRALPAGAVAQTSREFHLPGFGQSHEKERKHEREHESRVAYASYETYERDERRGHELEGPEYRRWEEYSRREEGPGDAYPREEYRRAEYSYPPPPSTHQPPHAGGYGESGASYGRPSEYGPPQVAYPPPYSETPYGAPPPYGYPPQEGYQPRPHGYPPPEVSDPYGRPAHGYGGAPEPRYAAPYGGGYEEGYGGGEANRRRYGESETYVSHSAQPPPSGGYGGGYYGGEAAPPTSYSHSPYGHATTTHKSIKNRGLDITTFLSLLSQQSGQDVELGGIRTALYSVFGAESSPMVQTFVGIMLSQAPAIMSQFSGGGTNSKPPGMMGIMSNLAMEFLKSKFGGSTAHHSQLSSVLGNATPIAQQAAAHGRGEQAHAGYKPPPQKRVREDMGILISACQAKETSADANPDGNPKHAYGAMSNALLTVLKENPGSLTVMDMVLKSREVLKRNGFTQKPGLYCGSSNLHAPFICD